MNSERERLSSRDSSHVRLVSEPFVSVSFVPTHRRIKASSGDAKMMRKKEEKLLESEMLLV
jgi:hypothetical protein